MAGNFFLQHVAIDHFLMISIQLCFVHSSCQAVRNNNFGNQSTVSNSNVETIKRQQKFIDEILI